ncbi:MAG: hypothetical protein ACXVGT_07425 [Oryzihumus sp.]
MAREQLQLTTDYLAPSPLWIRGGCVGDPRRLGVSAALTERLLAWQADFDEHFHWDRGWDASESAEAWAARGPRLLEPLQAELGDRYEVTLDLWPMDPGGVPPA